MKAVHFISRDQIDLQKWDACMAHSSLSLPYGYSWYLDAVAENWGGLVWGDYEAIMPLVWLCKWGLKCLYQPYYCQQLGVFSKQAPTEIMQKEFLNYCCREFPYVHINVNSSSAVVEKEFRLKRKKNLLLDLAPEYSSIRKKYSDNLKRNIAKAQKADLKFEISEDIDSFRKFYLSNIRPDKENFKPKHRKIMVALTDELFRRRLASIYRVLDEKGEWMASSLIIIHAKRRVNIINTSSAAGKKLGASHFLFDSFIRQNCAKGLLLDFEGSSIPSIARFYESFGAEEEVFYNFRYIITERVKQHFLQK